MKTTTPKPLHFVPETLTRHTILLVATFALAAAAVSAESTASHASGIAAQPGSLIYEYLRDMELSGIATTTTRHYHSLSTTNWRWVVADHPWSKSLTPSAVDGDGDKSSPVLIDLISSRVMVSGNTGYPHGFNDGLLWQGRGVNTSVVTGVQLKLPFVTTTLAPEIAYSQNRAFPINESQEYSSIYGNSLDNPQRLGSEPLLTPSLGQSSVRLKYGPVSLGIGTQNQIIGPAVRNPLLLSSNAPGFPHIDLGTERLETPVGSFESRALWGRLSESDFFDDNSTNDHNLFTGLFLAYSPPFLASLTLGANRVVLTDWSDMTPTHWFVMFLPSLNGENVQDTRWGYDDMDQRFSLTAEWLLPQSGFKLYGEWARNDYNSNWRQLFAIPGHSQAYTLGMQKTESWRAESFWIFTAELTELWLSRDYYANDLSRGGTFYSHGIVRQGQTHDGQLLGAGIGSGANAQYLHARNYRPFGFFGAALQRHARNQDIIYNSPEPGDHLRLNVEGSISVEAGVFLGEQLLYGGMTLSRNLNWNYVQNNDRDNVHLFLALETQF